MLETLARLPLVFEAHHGRADEDVRFLARAAGHSALFFRDAVILRSGAAEVRMKLAGADPGAIRLAFEGADRLRLTPEGDLSVEAGGIGFLQREPRIYQEVAGKRRPVEGGYALGSGNEVTFEIAGYDTAGNVYITGNTFSRDFPLMRAAQSTLRSRDEFVAKLNPTGSALIYSTYLGGSGWDHGNAIAVDAEGNAYVAGDVDSNNFPVRNALTLTMDVTLTNDRGHESNPLIAVFQTQ